MKKTCAEISVFLFKMNYVSAFQVSFVFR